MIKHLFIFFLFSGIAGSAQSILNAYAKVSSISGSVLNVSNVNQVNHTFTAGNDVIVMQMQDDVIGTNTTNIASFGNVGSINNAGIYEVATISAVTVTSGTLSSITLTSALTNTYNTGANASVQVISFRNMGTNYMTTSNITGLAWDGNIGGVIALQATNTFTLVNSISANAIGFRGGAINNTNTRTSCQSTVYTGTLNPFGGKGEGIYKSTNANFVAARGKILNGGGGSSDNNSGGGGGGNYSAGGVGGPGYSGNLTGCSPSAGGLGGLALSSYISPNRVFMGGGGGGGNQDNGGLHPEAMAAELFY